MQAKRIVIVTVIALLTLAIAFGVSAQDNTGGSNGQGNIGFNKLSTDGQVGIFPSDEGSTFFVGLHGAMPRNATLLGVAFLDGFNTYTFDLNSLFGTQGQTTLSTLGQNTQNQNNAQIANDQQCDNVRVYKLSPEGVQDLWTNASCTGDLLSVEAGGRGHYILYRFTGDQSADNAPRSLFSCTAQGNANVNLGARAGTQAQAGNVVCLTGQTNAGTTAGQGTIQGQADTGMTVNLQPINNSGVSGTVIVTPSTDGANVSVSAHGLHPNTAYLSLYYTNSTCALEADSLSADMIGSQYAPDSSGNGSTSAHIDEAADEIHSVSVRLGTTPNQLLACASF